jgi:hypothetical protein
MFAGGSARADCLDDIYKFENFKALRDGTLTVTPFEGIRLSLPTDLLYGSSADCQVAKDVARKFMDAVSGVVKEENQTSSVKSRMNALWSISIENCDAPGPGYFFPVSFDELKGELTLCLLRPVLAPKTLDLVDNAKRIQKGMKDLVADWRQTDTAANREKNQTLDQGVKGSISIR